MERYELPDGWTYTTLGEVVEINYGKGLPERIRKDGNINVFGSNGIIGYHNIALTEGETLIIGRKGTVGAVHLSDTACWPIDTTYFVDNFPLGLDARYIFYFLNSQDLTQLDRSTAVPGINRDDLYGILLPLAPSDEQSRIIAKIEALFEQSRTAREALDAIPALLRQFRQAVLAAAFRGELSTRDPNDEPASVLLERILEERRRRWEEDLRAKGKDPRRYTYEEPAPPDTSDLPELPEGWCWATVEQLGAIDEQAVLTGPFGSNLGRDDFVDTGVPVLTIGCLTEQGIVLDKAFYVSEEKAVELARYRVQQNDILFSRMASVGRADMVSADIEGSIINSLSLHFLI